MPITLCTGSNDSRHNYLLENKSGSLDLNGVMDTSDGNNHRAWVKLNVDQSGFYRVKYDDELAARLRYAIQSKQLSATDRYGN